MSICRVVICGRWTTELETKLAFARLVSTAIITAVLKREGGRMGSSSIMIPTHREHAISHLFHTRSLAHYMNAILSHVKQSSKVHLLSSPLVPGLAYRSFPCHYLLGGDWASQARFRFAFRTCTKPVLQRRFNWTSRRS